MVTPPGEVLGRIEAGLPIANRAFGEGGTALNMTSGDGVLRLPLGLRADRE